MIRKLLWCKYLCGIFFVVFVLSAFNGIEDWVFMRDSQNNEYYRDSRGKMVVLGKFQENRRPVSAQNAEFYFHQALTLLSQPEKRPKLRAVRYLKEILLLPSAQASKWQKKSAHAINYYRRIWGDHFTNLEKNIHYLRYEDLDKKEIFLYLPHAFLSVRYPAQWKYLEMRMVKEKYTHLHAVLIGNKGVPVEQMVIAYDRFVPLTFTSVQQYRELWHQRMTTKQYRRVQAESWLTNGLSDRFRYIIFPLRRLDSDVVFSEQNLPNQHRFQKKNLAGMEHYLRQKNFGYYISWTVDQKYFDASLGKFRKIVDSIKVNP